ncbi:MAG: helix-turn-helix domain-containing protein [Nocardioides sp.]|uniref:helix-turn-helix domain-containing protein n=1 Tax=Nocardioides sp. TaxID=35761 RepID=UPI0039E25EAC
MVDPTRGVLYPARLPRLTRLPPPPAAVELVGWYWISEWDIAPGRSSRQELVTYPVSNLVVEQDLVGLAGPTTRISHRDLIGRGWAVGALLRPAAVGALVERPAQTRDSYVVMELPDLLESVRGAMDAGEAASRHAAAVAAFSDWLVALAGELDDQARLANAMSELLMADPEVRRVEEAAARLAVSTRTLQRLARRYVGISPAAMIRRRRLQEAAARLRATPGADLAEIAADLGYADQAHLAADFRTVLAFTPSQYRRDAAAQPPSSSSSANQA